MSVIRLNAPDHQDVIARVVAKGLPLMVSSVSWLPEGGAGIDRRAARKGLGR